MKAVNYLKWLVIMLICFLPASCELLKEDPTEEYCREYDISPPETRQVQLQYYVSSSENLPDSAHQIIGAKWMNVIGVIQKINCRGNVDSHKEINYTIHPSQITTGHNDFTFNLSGKDDWTFLNDNDYFVFTFKIDVSFEDGYRFLSEESLQTSEKYIHMGLYNADLFFTVYTPFNWSKTE